MELKQKEVLKYKAFEIHVCFGRSEQWGGSRYEFASIDCIATQVWDAKTLNGNFGKKDN